MVCCRRMHAPSSCCVEWVVAVAACLVLDGLLTMLVACPFVVVLGS